jgi:hypothetical protein
MTQVQHSSGIPMPPFSYLAQEAARNSRAHSKFFSFGAVMKDHSQKDSGNPYSPLMCILLRLVFGAATQLGHFAPNW